MQHVGRHDFGQTNGSATWLDRRDGKWWVTFAHYAWRGGVPGKGPGDTRLVAYDDGWQPLAEYRYPDAVIERFGTRSCSGGAWGPDGRLYVTGHDAKEVYLLRVPASGEELELLAIVPVEAEGQGIAWDPTRREALYTIIRSRREVVISKRGRE
jgi:hypothetical protein